MTLTSRAIALAVAIYIPYAAHAEQKCSPAKHEKIPNILNTPYSRARKILIENAWEPIIDHKDREAPAGRSDFFKKGWLEVNDCAGTGFGQCFFRFSDTLQNTLYIATIGEDDDPKVLKIYLECK